MYACKNIKAPGSGIKHLDLNIQKLAVIPDRKQRPKWVGPGPQMKIASYLAWGVASQSLHRDNPRPPD